jgi:hypothetical protein
MPTKIPGIGSTNWGTELNTIINDITVNASTTNFLNKPSTASTGDTYSNNLTQGEKAKIDPRAIAAADLTIFVNATTGSDTNPGLSNTTPVQTIYKALALASEVQMSGKKITISFAPSASKYKVNSALGGKIAINSANFIEFVGSGANSSDAVIEISNDVFVTGDVFYFGISLFSPFSIKNLTVTQIVPATSGGILGSFGLYTNSFSIEKTTLSGPSSTSASGFGIFANSGSNMFFDGLVNFNNLGFAIYALSGTTLLTKPTLDLRFTGCSECLKSWGFTQYIGGKYTATNFIVTGLDVEPGSFFFAGGVEFTIISNLAGSIGIFANGGAFKFPLSTPSEIKIDVLGACLKSDHQGYIYLVGSATSTMKAPAGGQIIQCFNQSAVEIGGFSGDNANLGLTSVPSVFCFNLARATVGTTGGISGPTYVLTNSATFAIVD